MTLIIKYISKHWLIYGLAVLYGALLVLNAIGIRVWLPGCLITKISGYSCFGCGLNRAVIHLFKAEFLAAFESNPLVFLYLPLVIGWILVDFYNFRIKLKQPSNEQN